MKPKNSLIVIVHSLILIAILMTGCKQNQSGESNGNSETGKPNILVIVADDMGYSDIGPFGSEIKTPVLDKLAEQGVRLSGFHVLPTCSPTRSVLLSGSDNHVAGMGVMGELSYPQLAGRDGYVGKSLPNCTSAQRGVGNCNNHPSFPSPVWQRT